MDLFTKRCTCGAIFKPALASSRQCAKCEADLFAAKRAATPAAGFKEPAHKPERPYQAEPKAPEGWTWGAPDMTEIFRQLKKDELRYDLPTVNGQLIPKGSSYKVGDLRRGAPGWMTQFEYDVVYGSDGQAFRTKRQPFRPDAGTVQAIIETVDEAVRNKLDPYMFSRLTRVLCDDIARIVEAELERCLPVNVRGVIVEYGPEQGGRPYAQGFRVRARLFSSGTDSHDLTWTFR